MKRICILLATAAALLSCARSTSYNTNDASKRYIEGYLTVNYGADKLESMKTSLGSYILEWEEGAGEPVKDTTEAAFIYLDHVQRSLTGEFISYTIADTAKQDGLYDKSNYYGPRLWKRSDNGLSVGIEEILAMMRIGGRARVLIPAWLQTTTRYSDPASYYKQYASGLPYTYNITLLEQFYDSDAWEKDSIDRYMARNFPLVERCDTGYYSVTIKPSDRPDSTFSEGTNVYLNYTGRLLNGQMFDTTIEKDAKDGGIYDADTDYEPTYVTWASSASGLKMGGSESSMIAGFAQAIFEMKPHQKISCIFYSPLGYSSSGSGLTIPSYSPLRFDIELIDTPE